MVEQLEQHNAALVPAVRLASMLLGLGVFFVIFGAGWSLL